MDEKRHPTGRSLDKTEPQVWKHIRNLIQHQISEGMQWRKSRVRPLPVSFQVKHGGDLGCSGAGVNADRKVNIHRRLVDREKIGIVQGIMALDPAEENSSGAVRFSSFNFLYRFVNRP